MITVRLEELVGDKWVAKDIDLPVEEDFAIDEQNLDREMCTIGSRLVFYGDLHGELRAQLTRKKKNLEVVAAELAQQIRAAKIPKQTEGAIREQVLLNTSHQIAVSEFIIAEKDSIKVEGFYKSLHRIVDLSVALTYKQKAEIQKIGSFN